MKAALFSIAMVVVFAVGPKIFAEDVTLTSAQVKFDTTTNDKDHDTKLDVYVKDSEGNEVGKSEGNEGHWNDHSSHTVTLTVEGKPTKTEVSNGSVTLTIHPNGNDKWEFNYKVALKFSDKSIITKEVNGCVLAQDDASRTDSLK